MKRLIGILLTSMITVATATPTWACTPPLGVGNIWGDLKPPREIEYTPSEDIDKSCDNAAVSARAALDPVYTFPRPECGRLAHGLDEK